MGYFICILWMAICLLTTMAPAQTTLKAVKKRGQVLCGVNSGLPGFATLEASGQWRGFDVDYCRAIASAIFNDPDKVAFNPLVAKERFPALQSGGIDVLSRNTTWTFKSDTAYGFNFGPTLFYDGQGMMVPKDLGQHLSGADARVVLDPGSALRNLNGAKICVQAETTSEANLADFFHRYGLQYTSVLFKVPKDMYAAYDRGGCSVVTSDFSQLLVQKTTLKAPSQHVILGVLLSKEPLGPVVRHRDDQWFDIIKWVAFGLIQAEEYGITSQTINQALQSQNLSIRRFLGLEEGFGSMLGLNDDFMVRVISQVGNYSEIFDRNLQPLGLSRGANALWNEGGLLFAPPFR
jgi:general L-amino acid transport system substrate-binding protein